MTSTLIHAEKELRILCKSLEGTEEKPIVEEFIPEILAICEKFGQSGQSGGSAPYVASVLSKTIKLLCLQQPICPITGIDDEWNDLSNVNGGEILYQNNRCAALFKDGIDSTPYYLDAIVWKENNDYQFNGTAILPDGTKITSRQYIKLPFTPKTFYIDVDSIEVRPGEWEHVVKDVKQLDKVFKYYIKK